MNELKDLLCSTKQLSDKEAELVNLGFPAVVAE